MKARTQLLTLEPLEDRSLLSTCTVTNLLDVGRGGMSIGSGQVAGDLRFCINQANAIQGPDVIDFMVNGTINLRRPLPDLASDIDIQGPGSGLLTIRRNTGGDYRIFTVSAGVVAIRGLSVTNGKSEVGGGIYSQADLTLEEVSVTSNTNTAGQGGGIYNTGTLLVTLSTISANTSKGPGVAYGGGIYNTEFGEVTINSSNITSNVATGSTTGSSVYGGGIYNDGNLTIQAGSVSDNRAITTCGSGCNAGFLAAGGGIYNNAGSLEIFGVSISDNLAEANRASSANTGTVSGVGGGVYNSGFGDVIIASSAVTDNIARGDTAISTYAIAAGAGIYNGGILDIRETMISGNLADGKTGYMTNAHALGAGIQNFGALTVERSTISDNVAMSCVYEDGFARSYGGGISHEGGTATIVNSTIASNELMAISGEPLFYDTYARGGGLYASAPITILHSTIAHNINIPDTPGDWAGAGVSGGHITMHNSIIAGNSGAGSPDVHGALVSSGYNLIGNSSGGSGYAPTDLLDVNPSLGSLAANGGSTLTMALLPGSPAIDAGDNADAPEFDQRGPGFPRISNDTIDIGAFEVQATSAPNQPNLFTFLITAELDDNELETFT